ncbi:glycosyltransferase family protein [Mariniflexile sp. AS56]|uniref:glycosyltransferase family protein n=1 Tax=Mariniflexile sp. AS56 TaxID=3063957 RepID=UPI0026E9381B|nr:glycosyltransferase family protein [Mariniflexile sp. AS56]MDO7174165.1 glycosyltransferase family protein [Mariniflexile sp. AS56]
MKVLYAIQGTGNGHLSRARDIIPILQEKDIELDILVSGTEADINIPYPITFQLKGLSFVFGKKGGVDVWKTYFKAKSMRLHKEINTLPVENYDLIINDFEPVSAWACKLKKIPCVSLSHQAAVLASNAPRPKKKDALGKLILKKYAPTTKQYGFHFKAYQADVFTPVIRQDIRNAVCKKGDHYTVYLPSYDDEKILNILSEMSEVTWDVFSKRTKKVVVHKNIRLQPITNETFVLSMATSQGILCGAGFETPAEALFMKKKLLVIPMKGQYEQQCNAAALKDLGVPVIKALKKKYIKKMMAWVASDVLVDVDYPDITEQIIDQLLQEHL